MLYWRGDLRYIFIVAPDQYTWIREHLNLVATDHQKAGMKLKKPAFGVRGESWEWTIEEGRSPLQFDPSSVSKRSARFNKLAI